MTDPSTSRNTALVTGASAGIGGEFVKLLAEKGHDLVLVSRNEEKLRPLAEELSARHTVRVETIPIDLSIAGAPEHVASQLKSKAIEVDILVNNAGSGTFGPFAESDPVAGLAQIQVNVVALTHLTRLLLPPMIARGRGRILNVASTAAFQPGPLMAVYYATKAYVLSFSEALANELKGTGVTVTCLCPGPTRTEFMDRAGVGTGGILQKKGVVMEAAEVARRGYNGMMKGRRLVIPGVMNKLLAHATRLGTRSLNATIVRRFHESIQSASAQNGSGRVP
jgi:hypothetical protein